jgi:hypothetical protein
VRSARRSSSTPRFAYAVGPGVVERDYPGASMRQNLDDALRFEQLERLAQGHPAHPHARRDLSFDQALAVFNRASGDAIGQGIGNPNGKAGLAIRR